MLRLGRDIGSGDTGHAILAVILLEIIQIQWHGTEVFWQYPLPTPRNLKDF
jgi:hypothetical protein